MKRRTQRFLSFLSVGLPLLGMVACSGSSSKLTGNLWKVEHIVSKKGGQTSAPNDLYFDFRKGSVLLDSKRPKDTAYWEKKGKKINIYKSAKKNKKEETWTIKKLSKDTLKIESNNQKGTMITSASDEKFKDVTK